MKIALCSDEPYPVHHTIENYLQVHGHECVALGAFGRGNDVPWATVAEEAALMVANEQCEEGIFLCWSGTGISIAANKIFGVRAALCSDPGTARAARVYNHANVLCLSNRTLSDDMAKEILEVWFTTSKDESGAEGVRLLERVDATHRRLP
jgi:ribose 5-phosphate isomerase B